MNNMDTIGQEFQIMGKFNVGGECRALLIPEEESGCSIICKSLPGVVSQGATESEALARLDEAIRGAIQSYRDLGKDIPWSSAGDNETPLPANAKWVVVNY